MRRLFEDIVRMRLDKRPIYSPPDNRVEKQVPATIQLVFPKQLTAAEVQSTAELTGLKYSAQQGQFTVVEGTGFRIHVAKPTKRGTFLQIQRTEMSEELPAPGKAYEFMLNLPTNRKRDLLRRAAQLLARLRR